LLGYGSCGIKNAKLSGNTYAQYNTGLLLLITEAIFPGISGQAKRGRAGTHCGREAEDASSLFQSSDAVGNGARYIRSIPVRENNA
jgi:hypothetical protein